MAEVAHSVGVTTMVGLQARANPGVVHMKELVASGYVGEVLSCHVSMSRPGALSRPSMRTWQREDRLGATTLTIPFGHTVDAMRYVVGDFREVAAVVSTQTRQWLETDTTKLVDVDAPDHVLVTGRLTNDAVASVHVASVPWIGSDFRMEVFGREGTLVASSAESPQLGPVQLQGARGAGADLAEIEIPAAYQLPSESAPASEAYNVALMYRRFADAIRTGSPGDPSFDTAVALHQLLDAVRAASDTGHAQPTG
jgi:predicted dehydrogenase